MKNLKNLFVLGLALVFSISAFGQATTTKTTFSTAVAYGDTQVLLTSATGVTGQVQGAYTTILYSDKEAMGVQSITGTVAQVTRGLDGTRQASHTTTAFVWVGGPTYFSLNADPSGSCTGSNETALPRFFELSGNGFNCPAAGPNAGQWVLEYPAPFTVAPLDSSQFSPTVAQGVCHFQYNFAVDGGAINTALIPKNNCTVPKGAIITGATMYASTAGTTSASGTLAIGVSGTGGAANSFLAATAAASITGVLQSAVVPQTASGFIHLTTAGQGEVAIATGALTAGVVDVWLFYTVSPL